MHAPSGPGIPPELIQSVCSAFRRRFRRYCLLFAILTLAACGSPADRPHIVKKNKQITVREFPEEGGSSARFTGITEIERPLSDVMACLKEIDSYPHWIANCNGVTVSPGLSLTWKQPWPWQDWTLFCDAVASSPDQVTIASHSTGKHPVFFLSFNAEPSSQGETRVSLTLMTHPDGSLPEKLNRIRNAHAVYGTLKNLRNKLSVPTTRQDIDLKLSRTG